MSTLHVVSLPHTQTNGEYATCAYTEKIRKFCTMMTGRDRRVILYGGEFNTAPVDEHVVCVTEEQRLGWFGPHELGDLERGGFDWSNQSPWWSTMNARAIGAIMERAEPTDLLLLSSGNAQQIIADALPQLTVAEFGVGYEGIITNRNGGPAFAAFESYAHRHMLYGLLGWRRGREYDTVIPNYFDPRELPRGDGAGGYLLYIGRLIWNKGIHTAALVSEATGIPLKVAGPGGIEWGDGFVRFPEGEVRAPGLEYVGPVGIEERGELMGAAGVTLVPTVYVEPFGGVAVESMMCGTPVVTTDWGAFTETVRTGVSGYRFETLQEAVTGTLDALELDRTYVRNHALMHYSLDAVAPMYDRWFTNLDGLWGEGWTAVSPDSDRRIVKTGVSA